MKHTKILIICLYVDDLLLIGSSSTGIDSLKQNLKKEFEMTDLGTLSYFLGLEFAYTEQGIFMHQKKYISNVLKRSNMWDCNPTKTPVEVNLKFAKGANEASVDGTLFR